MVVLSFTSLNVKKLTPQELYELIGKFIENEAEEIFSQTGKVVDGTIV